MVSTVSASLSPGLTGACGGQPVGSDHATTGVEHGRPERDVEPNGYLPDETVVHEDIDSPLAGGIDDRSPVTITNVGSAIDLLVVHFAPLRSRLTALRLAHVLVGRRQPCPRGPLARVHVPWSTCT